MTDRQKAYATQLVAERTQALQQMVATGALGTSKASYALRFQRGTTSPTVRQASAMIEWLLAIPRDEAATPAADPAPDVAAGRYAVVDADGVVKFYRVDKPTDGRWAGYTFVKVQASEEWYSVRDRAARNAILEAIAVDALGAMQRYGLELGHCGNCGRALTDETSRQMGIGPDCAQRLGLDRSPYAEAARREQVARVLALPDNELEDAIIKAEAADVVRGEAACLDSDDLAAERA